MVLSSSPPAPGSRVVALDGLRICAISLVVLSHLVPNEEFPRFIARNWRLGGLGVTIFLLLSGFVVTRLLLRTEQKKGRISLSEFYRRRWWRLLPPIILFVLVCLGFQALGWMKFSGRELLASLTFTRNLVPGDYYTGHLWSLGVQEQFYLVWPALLILAPARFRFPVAVALVVLQPIWAQICFRWFPPAQGIFRSDLRALPLLVGATLALAHEQNRLRDWLRHPWLAHTGLFLVAFAAVVAMRYDLFIGPYTLWRLMEYVCLALMLNQLIVGPNSLTARFLALPLLVWLGQQAYQIYLWQQIFVTNGSLPFQFFPLNVLLLAAVAVTTFFLVEKPLLRLRARYEERRNGKPIPVSPQASV